MMVVASATSVNALRALSILLCIVMMGLMIKSLRTKPGEPRRIRTLAIGQLFAGGMIASGVLARLVAGTAEGYGLLIGCAAICFIGGVAGFVRLAVDRRKQTQRTG